MSKKKEQRSLESTLKEAVELARDQRNEMETAIFTIAKEVVAMKKELDKIQSNVQQLNRDVNTLIEEKEYSMEQAMLYELQEEDGQ